MRLDHATAPEAEAKRLGPMAAEITNAIVKLFRETVGRGPTHARTIIDGDVVATVLHGGFTAAEQSLHRAGRGDIVDAGRAAMQEILEQEMRTTVERVTGRRVTAFLSANHNQPDLSIETFILEGPPPGAASSPGADRA